MYNNSYNGMDRQAVATINNNFSSIITNVGIICPDMLKYYLKHDGRMDLGDGMYLAQPSNDFAVLRVYLPDGNWFNVLKNHSVGTRCNWKYVAEQVREIVCRHYNVPNPEYFLSFNDWANDLYEYGFCNSDKRRAKFDACFNAIGA